MMKSFKIKKKIFMTGMAIVLSLFVLAAPLTALALEVNDGDGEFVYQWKGNGKNSLDCTKAGEGDRPDDGTGWIHWVFTTKGNSTDAELTLGGSGSGSYSPGEPLEASVWHFYTPYFDVYELTASIALIGGEKGPGVGLVISDYCPGIEQVVPMLTIEKELLDLESIQVLESEVEFEFKISGGVFGAGQVFSFSVDEPKEFGPDDGLAFDVEYLIEEVENEAYQFISISQSSVTLTEENNFIIVTIINQEKEEEEETGSIIIEKLIKADVDAEVVIPLNKTFFFNIYNNETDELVNGDVELEVIDGVSTVTIDNLPLGIYRVEEVVNGGYQVVLDPEDGVVDLTAEENEVTVVVVNTPKPELVIEKVLLDSEGVEIVNSDVKFTVILDGGLFDEQEIVFSVNEPAVLEFTDGLEFDVPYTVNEVAKDGYIFVSIDPEEAFTLTDKENEVTVTIVNQEEEEEEEETGRLVIEKVLLDSEGVEVANSEVDFTVILDGGLFDEEEIIFSVNEPAVLEFSDGLEFDVPYTVTEVAKEGYIFVSIDPEVAFILTEEGNEVTVTIVNQMVLAPPLPPVDPPQTPTPPPAGPPVIIFAPPVPPQVIVVPPTGPQVSPPPQVVVVLPTPPQTIPQGGVEEEDAVAFFVSPEDPLSEPEEVLVVQPARPLSTPRTGGIYLNLILVSLVLLGSGIIIRKQLIK